jgi:hypothetical protein
MILKVVSKAGRVYRKNTEQQITKENLTRLSEPLERVFKEASKNLIFSHQQGSKKS